MRYFDNTNINFVGSRKIFFFVSLVIIVGGVLATIFLGPVYGIDFEGGTEVAVKFKTTIEANQIRSVVENAGFTGSEIKSFGGDNQYLIRIRESGEGPERLTQLLKDKFTDFDEIIKVDKVGPKIGDELRFNAFIAVILSVLAILLYIAFRFEFTFGLGAVTALLHDIVVTFSFIVIIHHLGIVSLEIDQTILAGMLTVVGFSINDTVIIFDRIRENRDKHKGMNFIKMVNLSINETLSRTINTVFTAMLVLVTIVAFGGPVLKGFAITMLIGIITGTYSSIYIASSFVIFYLEKVRKLDLSKGINVKEAATGKA